MQTNQLFTIDVMLTTTRVSNSLLLTRGLMYSGTSFAHNEEWEDRNQL